MLTAGIDGADFRRAVKMLKDGEPDTLKQLRKDLRSDIKPFASKVLSAQPSADQVPSGFLSGYAATRWEPSKATVSFTTGRSKRPGWSSLISVKFGPSGKSRGYAIMELAGTRTSGSSTQGKALISFLNAKFPNNNKKGGRFFWQAFQGLYPEIMGAANNSVDRFEAAFNRKI